MIAPADQTPPSEHTRLKSPRPPSPNMWQWTREERHGNSARDAQEILQGFIHPHQSFTLPKHVRLHVISYTTELPLDGAFGLTAFVFQNALQLVKVGSHVVLVSCPFLCELILFVLPRYAQIFQFVLHLLFVNEQISFQIYPLLL